MNTEHDERGVRGLKEAVPDRRAKQTADFTVEYGVRLDDQAMVFHFYPPGTDWSDYPPQHIGEWRAAYDMEARLEAAMPKCFDVKHINATYVTELRSYCIIVRGAGHSVDPWLWAERFLTMVDAPQDAAASGRG